MAAVGLIGFTAASMAGLALLRGLVLQATWAWFVVETFDLAPLTLVQAIGLLIVASFMTHQIVPDNDDSTTGTEKLVAASVAGVVWCIVVYLFAAIVHAFA